MTIKKSCDGVKGVICSDDPTENYRLNLQHPSGLRSFAWFTRTAIAAPFSAAAGKQS